VAAVSATAYFVIGFIVLHSALLVWTAVVLPAPVDRARRQLETAPLRTLLWGLLALGLALALITVLLLIRLPCIELVSDWLNRLSQILSVNRVANDAQMLTHAAGWMLLGPFWFAWICGGAAFAEICADRLQCRMDRPRRISALIAGAFCTSGGAFLPFVGWFLFFPAVGLLSLGAGLRGLWPAAQRSPSREVAAGGRRAGASAYVERTGQPTLQPVE
jgi:hypothetical protein